MRKNCNSPEKWRTQVEQLVRRDARLLATTLVVDLFMISCLTRTQWNAIDDTSVASPSPTVHATGPTPTPKPVPTYTLSAMGASLPTGARLLQASEFGSPVEVLASIGDLPPGDLLVWSSSVEEEGMTDVGYVTYDGKAGRILRVGSKDAWVVGVGGGGTTLVVEQGTSGGSTEAYLLALESGELWGYSFECKTYDLDVGELYMSYTCPRDGGWVLVFVSLAPSHPVVERTDPHDGVFGTTWQEDDQIVLEYFGDRTCMAQVSSWDPVCVEYPELGYINMQVALAEAREDGPGLAPMEWRIGFIPIECIWLGPATCPIRWFEQPMSNLRFSSPGVWLPDSAGLLLLEEPGDDKGVQRLRELDPVSGAMRFIGAYPKPFINVLENRGVAIVSPGNQIVVDRRFADEYALLSLEDGTLSPLLGKEGEELRLNSNGLLRVP